jgi:hypothetical protein
MEYDKDKVYEVELALLYPTRAAHGGEHESAEARLASEGMITL